MCVCLSLLTNWLLAKDNAVWTDSSHNDVDQTFRVFLYILCTVHLVTKKYISLLVCFQTEAVRMQQWEEFVLKYPRITQWWFLCIITKCWFRLSLSLPVETCLYELPFTYELTKWPLGNLINIILFFLYPISTIHSVVYKTTDYWITRIWL